MPQEQIQAKPVKRKRTEPAVVEETPTATEHVTVEDVDALLDEIDSVLEHNANEVVRAYRQKGGE